MKCINLNINSISIKKILIVNTDDDNDDDEMCIRDRYLSEPFLQNLPSLSRSQYFLAIIDVRFLEAAKPIYVVQFFLQSIRHFSWKV